MRRFACAAALVFCVAAGQPSAEPSLANDLLTAKFGERGLVAIVDREVGAYSFVSDDFSISIDGSHYDSRSLSTPSIARAGDGVTYTWAAGDFTVAATYEVAAGRRFITKQLSIHSNASKGGFRVDEVTVFREESADSIDAVFIPKSVKPALGTRDYGGFIRSGSRGLLATVQNPFLEFERTGQTFSIRYRPDIEWRPG